MSLRYTNDMNNYNHIMLDIETMSIKPNAMVLSIAAIAFDPFEITTDFSKNPQLDLLLSLEEQSSRDVQEVTAWWWQQRDQSVRDKIFGDDNRVLVVDALQQLSKFVWMKNTIWCQGPTLDITVLTDLYESNNLSVPWKYHVVRDSRTLLDLVEIEPEPDATHDAIEDVVRQSKLVQKALKKLGVTKFVR